METLAKRYEGCKLREIGLGENNVFSESAERRTLHLTEQKISENPKKPEKVLDSSTELSTGSVHHTYKHRSLIFDDFDFELKNKQRFRSPHVQAPVDDFRQF